MFGLKSRWLAWQFDQAVLTFGRYVESELEKVKADSETRLRVKRRVKLHELLGMPAYTYVP